MGNYWAKNVPCLKKVYTRTFWVENSTCQLKRDLLTFLEKFLKHRATCKKKIKKNKKTKKNRGINTLEMNLVNTLSLETYFCELLMF